MTDAAAWDRFRRMTEAHPANKNHAVIVERTRAILAKDCRHERYIASALRWTCLDCNHEEAGEKPPIYL